MNIVKKIIICSAFISIMAGCMDDKKETDVSINDDIKRISSTNLNILITPDLSNRVVKKKYPKPVSDINLIKNIFDNYYPNIYQYNNRISKQNDYLNLVFTNSNIISEYDYNGVFTFDILEKENNNRSYLKTFDNSITEFKKETNRFISKLEEVYNKTEINPAGADIFSFLKHGINNNVKKDKLNNVVQNYIIDKKYRNIIVLFTDGYLEYGLYTDKNCIGNKCYFLDNSFINKFRKDFINNGVGSDTEAMKVFFKNNNYGIIPVDNDILKDELVNLEIMVCEVYDRSLDKKTGSQRVIPSDFEIIKIFWEDWLYKSGFKKVKIYQKVSSIDEFESNLLSFIND